MGLEELYNSDFKGDHEKMFNHLTMKTKLTHGVCYMLHDACSTDFWLHVVQFHPDRQALDLKSILRHLNLSKTKTKVGEHDVFTFTLSGNGTYFFQDIIKDINVAAFEFERSSKSYMATCKHDCMGEIQTELQAALAGYKNVKVETIWIMHQLIVLCKSGLQNSGGKCGYVSLRFGSGYVPDRNKRHIPKIHNWQIWSGQEHAHNIMFPVRYAVMAPIQKCGSGFVSNAPTRHSNRA